MTIMLANYPPISPGEVIALSGTSGSPNTKLGVTTSPTDALVQWRWNYLTGEVEFRTSVAGGYTAFNPGVEYSNENPPSTNLWIRFTDDGGAGDVPPTAGSSALNTWLQLNNYRYVEWRENTNGFATTRGQVKVEIATDALGANIVATGYYRGIASVEL